MRLEGIAVLVGLYCVASAVVARLAVAPLRGRPVGRSGPYVLLIACVAALPEAVSPIAISTFGTASPSLVGTSLGANLLTLVGLAFADVATRGKLLARAGLDQLLAVVCAAVMTVATAGAIMIDSTEPRSSPLGHVLSIGLLVACVVHLKWASLYSSADRPHNPRAPLPVAVPVGLAGVGVVLALLMVTLGRATRGELGNHTSLVVNVPFLLPALTAVPELAVLAYATRQGRPDIACSVALGSIILNFASMASMDLLGVETAAYRLDSPVPLLAIALVSTGLLGCLGGRLMHEERGIGG